MAKIIFITILLHLSVYANQLEMLKSIEDKALVYGSGQKKVYLFIDPWCKYSRKFVSLVSNNPPMLSKYKYYIYLYAIPRLHSKKAIAAVYQSKDPLKTLLDIMLNDDHQTALLTEATKNKIDLISNVAKTLHINKRPFIIIEK
jgi:protein-disulfide isomerase